MSQLSMNEVPQFVGNYELLSKLGSGSFACVFLARHTITGMNVAIKCVSHQTLDTQDAQTRFIREVSLLKQMDHPFIAELFEIIETPGAFYLVMEYIEHGNMLEFVNNNGRLTEDKARRYFCQLISALDYLHNKRFVAHRDLKAENVLLDRYDNIRLIDFGLSNQFTKGMPQLKTACGSPAYAAPEMIQGEPYTKAADMWSAGILLYAMVAGRLPFDDKNINVLLKKVVFEEVQYPPTMSRSLVDLLKRLLCKNPESRITMSRLKTHPWFSQSEYQSLMEFNFHDQHHWLVSDIPPRQINMNMNEFEVVDREIVEQMAKLGVDIQKLPQAIINGEYTPTTAIYRLLRKNKITEQMKDMMAGMQRSIGLPKAPIRFGTDLHMFLNKESSGDKELLTPRSGNQSILIKGISVLPQPQTKVYTRRMSRPVAVRRIAILPNSENAHIPSSLESP